jgi:hypothetical protein
MLDAQARAALCRTGFFEPIASMYRNWPSEGITAASLLLGIATVPSRQDAMMIRNML